MESKFDNNHDLYTMEKLSRTWWYQLLESKGKDKIYREIVVVWQVHTKTYRKHVLEIGKFEKRWTSFEYVHLQSN